MNWLAFIFALEAGIVPRSSFVMYERQAEVVCYQGNYYYPIETSFMPTGPIFYTDLQAEVELFKFFFFGGSIRVQMQDAVGKGLNFDPEALFYDIYGGVRWKGFELHVLRACRHPQMTYAFDYRAVSGWEGSYLEIGAKITGRWSPGAERSK